MPQFSRISENFQRFISPRDINSAIYIVSFLRQSSCFLIIFKKVPQISYIPDLDPIYPIPPINPPPAPFIYRRPPDTTQRPGRHAFYILSRYGGENRLQLRTKDKLLIDRLIGSGIGPNRLRIPPFARRFKTDRPSKPARRTSRRRRPPPCTQMLASLALANICSSRSLR